MGIISALGSGLDEHARALREGRSGLGPHELFGGREPDPCVCGIVPRKDLAAGIDESARDRADRLLDHAVKQALSEAGLGPGVEADIIAGTTLSNMHGGSLYYRDIRRGAEGDISLVRHFIPSAPVEFVARANAITGRHCAVCSACASASAALGQAFRRIAHGRCARAVAGGFDALSPFVVAGFNSLRLVSPSPSRPFDRDRDGLNPGEGAAMLVLESKDAALKRGARPLARIAGFGEALEAYHYTRADPEGSGLAASFRKALQSAGISPHEVGHLHLHGTGTHANDRSEYVACRKVFGEKLAAIPACSTKPLTGHTFGAAGAVNAVFSIVSIRDRFVPATRFCTNMDPEFEGLELPSQPQDRPGLCTVASSALGFGGEASVLIFSKVGA